MKSIHCLPAVFVSILLLFPTAARADWASEVAASNPLHWWQFEETSGTSAADSGSAGLNGTLVNGASLGNVGPVGGAVHLDGATNAHVLLSGTPLAAPWTLEAIFFQDDTAPGPSSALLGPEEFGAPNTAIKAEQWNETGQLGYTAFGVVDETFDDPAAATPSSYRHVALVGTDAGVSVYVNGSLADSEDTAIDLPRGVIGLSGFSDDDPIDAFGGFIDDLVIYDRELSAAEVAAHAAAVPEPGSLVLLAAAAALAIIRLRR